MRVIPVLFLSRLLVVLTAILCSSPPLMAQGGIVKGSEYVFSAIPADQRDRFEKRFDEYWFYFRNTDFVKLHSLLSDSGFGRPSIDQIREYEAEVRRIKDRKVLRFFVEKVTRTGVANEYEISGEVEEYIIDEAIRQPREIYAYWERGDWYFSFPSATIYD